MPIGNPQELLVLGYDDPKSLGAFFYQFFQLVKVWIQEHHSSPSCGVGTARGVPPHCYFVSQAINEGLRAP
jgi:hypothetical protein